eukprot:5635025-Pyramimonas_sp.AAC.1
MVQGGASSSAACLRDCSTSKLTTRVWAHDTLLMSICQKTLFQTSLSSTPSYRDGFSSFSLTAAIHTPNEDGGTDGDSHSELL